MEITIHLGSLFIGFVFGYLLVATVFLVFFFKDKYNIGFGQGWDYGYKHGKEEVTDEYIG